MADGLAALLRDVIQKHKYRTVVGINSTFGKDIVPRIAGHYLAQPITDIIEIIVNFA